MSAPNLDVANLESLEIGLKAKVVSPKDTLNDSPPRKVMIMCHILTDNERTIEIDLSVLM
jgi:hypothetical protein